MNDAIVSVRIPASLLKELHAIADHDHFLDLSECVRSIIRAKALQMLEQPVDQQQHKQSAQSSQNDKITKDLKKIIDQLEGRS